MIIILNEAIQYLVYIVIKRKLNEMTMLNIHVYERVRKIKFNAYKFKMAD